MIRRLFLLVLWLGLLASIAGLVYTVPHLAQAEPRFVSRPVLSVLLWLSGLVGCAVLLWKLPRPG